MANIVKKGKGSSTALAKPGQWRDELKQYAEEGASQEQIGGQFISFRAGKIKVGGNEVKSPLQVVVLDSCFENAYYPGKYKPDDRKPPRCFALAREEKTIAPHENVKKPFKATYWTPKSKDKVVEEISPDACHGCPLNEFDTQEDRAGKVCRNLRRLAVISANGLSEKSIKAAEVFYAKIPPTSTRGWAAYVKGLNATYSLPPFGMITEIHVEADEEKQVAISFREAGMVDESLIPALLERVKAQRDATMFGYPAASDEEEEEKPAKGKAAKGKPGKGKF